MPGAREGHGDGLHLIEDGEVMIPYHSHQHGVRLPRNVLDESRHAVYEPGPLEM